MNMQLWLDAYKEVIEEGVTLETVTSLVKSVSPIPSNALVLGVCQDDGIPVFMNMNAGHAYSLLYRGSDIEKNRRALMVMVKASVLNNAKNHEFSVITSDVKSWGEILPDKNMVCGMHTNKKDDLILSLAGWLNSRASATATKKHILLIDDIDSFVANSEFDTISNLSWIMSKGKYGKVKVIAGGTKLVEEFDDVLEDIGVFGLFEEKYNSKPFVFNTAYELR